MIKLPIVEPADAPDGVEEVYSDFKIRMGFPAPPNFIKAQGASLAVVRGTWGLVRNILVEGTLPRSLKEMVFVAISKDRGCKYCEAAHLACCRMLGVDAKTLEVLVSNIHEVTPEAARAVLLFAVKCSRSPQSLNQEDFWSLRRHGFVDGEITELIGMAGLAVYANILADATSIEADEMFGFSKMDPKGKDMPKQAPGVESIRLNLFFDLLFALSQIRDYDSLSKMLGTRLRFVIDFEDCYFILGDPRARPLKKVYINTKETLRPFPRKIEELNSNFEEVLRTYLLRQDGPNGGKILSLSLETTKGILGTLILTRPTSFHHTERQFVGAIGNFLAQILESIGSKDDLVRANTRLQQNEIYQKELIQKLEQERDLRERFVSALTHDLRTPLTVAKLNAEILVMKLQDPETIRVVSKRIITQVDRVDRMIFDLLDANRIKSGEEPSISAEECKLDRIVFPIVEDLNQIYGLRFLVVDETKGVQGFWDRSGIQRILENLITNAVKYGKPGTPITIHLTAGLDWVEISVHNEGIPITTEDQKLLFSQYRRTQAAIASGQGGWGIGLSLVQWIAKAHRGSVRVESSTQNGTTFYVRLAKDARRA